MAPHTSKKSIPEAAQPVIDYLIDHPYKSFTGRMIASIVGQTEPLVQGALEELVKLELISMQEIQGKPPLFRITDQQTLREICTALESGEVEVKTRRQTLTSRKQGEGRPGDSLRTKNPRLIETGVLGPDEVMRGRKAGEFILIVGPPGSAKTHLAMSLMYKALIRKGAERERGLFITCDESANHLKGSFAGMFMEKLDEYVDRGRLSIADLSPYLPRGGVPPLDYETVTNLANELEVTIETPGPHHIVIDGLTALQSTLGGPSHARLLTHTISAILKHKKSRSDAELDLIVVTAESSYGSTRGSYAENLESSFDEYLFDTVIQLDVENRPAGRRLRKIEVPKSRGRSTTLGRHTFEIMSEDRLNEQLQSVTTKNEVKEYDTPVVIFPQISSDARSGGQELEKVPTQLSTGIDGMDQLLDSEHSRGLVRGSITMLIGGPGAQSSTIATRFLAKGLEDPSEPPVLFINFGRDRGEVTGLRHRYDWLDSVLDKREKDFHFIDYSPINLDHNRLFFEIRREVETYGINRVVVHSLSSLPTILQEDEEASDFLVAFIGMLRNLHCTAVMSYVDSEQPDTLAAPGRLIPVIADNIIILRNVLGSEDHTVTTQINILKARANNAMREVKEVHIGAGGEIVIQSIDASHQAS